MIMYNKITSSRNNQYTSIVLVYQYIQVATSFSLKDSTPYHHNNHNNVLTHDEPDYIIHTKKEPNGKPHYIIHT